MQNVQNVTQRKRGPIQTMFDWTFAILLVLTIIGITFKYVLKPLYFF